MLINSNGFLCFLVVLTKSLLAIKSVDRIPSPWSSDICFYLGALQLVAFLFILLVVNILLHQTDQDFSVEWAEVSLLEAFQRAFDFVSCQLLLFRLLAVVQLSHDRHSTSFFRARRVTLRVENVALLKSQQKDLLWAEHCTRHELELPNRPKKAHTVQLSLSKVSINFENEDTWSFVSPSL